MPDEQPITSDTHTHEAPSGIAGGSPILYTHTHKFFGEHGHARYIGPADTFVEPGAHRFSTSTARVGILAAPDATANGHEPVGIPE